jgi:predicted RNA-binding protein YlxR (DUF448 family)
MNLYTSLKNAAEKLRDNRVLVRLSGAPNGDLVAVDTRYHRKKGCWLLNYINGTNSQPSRRVLNNTYKDTLDTLTKEYLVKE